MAGTTTGLAPLPDVGVLSYNGVTWSSLYHSKLESKIVLDEAARTTKFVEWTLEVSGMVTLEAGQKTTDQTFAGLRQRLSVCGANLKYVDKGFGSLSVNSVLLKDVAWGPIPEVLTFQPLGAARSAMVVWRVTFRIPELKPGSQGNSTPPGPVLQFNYEYALTYDEEGYVGATLHGTLEIPLTRAQNSRAIAQTVDDFRQNWLNISFDLTKYKVVHRDFKESRDQRTCEWEYQIQELPPAGLPVGSTRARGKMAVHPLRSGGGESGRPLASVRWACTLTATYSIRSDFPRRVAQFSFLSLLWFRMWSALYGAIPDANAADAAAQQTVLNAFNNTLAKAPAPPDPTDSPSTLAFYTQLASNEAAAGKAAYAAGLQAFNKNGADTTPAFPLLTDFSFEEGLYEDSRSITFHASWVVMTTFTTLMAATGVWLYPKDVGGTAWGGSVQSMMGWRSALAAQIDPNAEVIVDMGGGMPLNGTPIKKE